VLRSVLTAIIGTLILSENAFALSCMPPNLIKTLEAAKTSENTYEILVGKFVSLPSETRTSYYDPNAFGQGEYKPTPPKITEAFFNGYSLRNNPRLDVKLTRYPIDVETSCAGHWCGDSHPITQK